MRNWIETNLANSAGFEPAGPGVLTEFYHECLNVINTYSKNDVRKLAKNFTVIKQAGEQRGDTLWVARTTLFERAFLRMQGPQDWRSYLSDADTVTERS